PTLFSNIGAETNHVFGDDFTCISGRINTERCRRNLQGNTSWRLHLAGNSPSHTDRIGSVNRSRNDSASDGLKPQPLMRSGRISVSLKSPPDAFDRSAKSIQMSMRSISFCTLKPNSA